MKVAELLLEAAEDKDPGTIEIVDGPDDTLIVRTTAKSGPMLHGMYTVWDAVGRKKGVKTILNVVKRRGKPTPIEPDGMDIINKRPTKLTFSGVSRETLQAAVDKAIAKVGKTVEKEAKYKADAPARKAAASKANAEKRKTDMAEYDKKYGKGTWKRITYRQEGGDDGYAYVLRVDGRPRMNGLTQRQAMYYKEQEADRLAKEAGIGKYAKGAK
jgi:hypothetical protein